MKLGSFQGLASGWFSLATGSVESRAVGSTSASKTWSRGSGGRSDTDRRRKEHIDEHYTACDYRILSGKLILLGLSQKVVETIAAPAEVVFLFCDSGSDCCADFLRHFVSLRLSWWKRAVRRRVN